MANVCYQKTIGLGSSYADVGSFIVDVNGKFVNSAGVAVKSSDFETTSDTGGGTDIYYYNFQSVWVWLKNSSSGATA